METNQFPTVSYLSDEGELSSAFPEEIDGEKLLYCYRTMCLTRHLDEKMIILQRQGVITFSLASRGEEAAAVASALALEIQDWMYPQYREAGIAFFRGMSVETFINQMFGNSKDLGKGRQMPNHFGARELNIVTVSSPIGTNIPHAAGAAYAMKLANEPAVAICYFGEGAASEGDFHSGLNIAAVRKAPAIFFCRNNGYAISTPVSEQYASEGIAPRGAGYGIETIRVDGNDFFAVYDAVKRARAHCLRGKGPFLIESMSYRMGAHSTSDDPSRYRSNEEVKKHEKRCPLRLLRLYLEKQGKLSEAANQQMQEEIQQEVKQAIEAAKATPPPALKTLFEDVYSEVPKTLEEQYQDALRFFSEEGADG